MTSAGRTALAIRRGPRDEAHLDPVARDLTYELRRTIDGEVRFSPGDRAMYSTDASNYRQLPIGVVIPRHEGDVETTVKACRDRSLPILPRGGGTSLAGQSCNTAVVLDLSKYMGRILEVDPDRRTARVQAGAVLDDVRRAVNAAADRLTFAPDPATHDHCTIGGMVGNDACGVHSVLAEFHGPGPRTADNVEALEVLTYAGDRLMVGPIPEEALDATIRDGGALGDVVRGLRELRDHYGDEIRERFPDIPRRVSGYNLDELLPDRGFHLARALVGTEGTCATVLTATLTLTQRPAHIGLLVMGFDDVFAAADAVPMIRSHRPVALEGFDEVLVRTNRRKGMNLSVIERLPRGDGFLLVSVGGGSVDEVRALEDRLDDDLRRNASGFLESRRYEDDDERAQAWGLRESGLGATAFVPGDPDAWPGWEDSAVPPDHLGSYLRDLRALFDRFGYGAALYGHFGQGCVHCRIDFDLVSEPGIRRWRAFMREAADLVVSHGGSLSGEHGDGQARGELLPRMYGERLVEAFRRFKAIWDPQNRMNPGKVVDAAPLDAHLRLGTGYAPADVQTHLAYPDDRGDFARATLRCVGVGECRREAGGVMCPSYMVTREEEHSTRGRARLLFEMLNGAEVDRWRSDEVREALDLCLSCKGCKGECPVNVDIATYKAEFLAHHYARRLRPRVAYAMGLLPYWARLASRMPAAVNAVLAAPVVGGMLKRGAGIATERPAPRFAGHTFRERFAARGTPNIDGPPVIVWPDTFTDRFAPDIGLAAAEVLGSAGYRPIVPPAWGCCARPLYEQGMIPAARRVLRRTLSVLRPHLRAGTPVVGLEPSCVSMFRDELRALLPDDADANRLADGTLLLSEFLDEHAPDWEPPRLSGRALVQFHCHQSAVLDVGSEERLLRRAGLELERPEPGCCGMAGAFGFGAGRTYEVSVRVGERSLLPAVRKADADTLIVADGFSCRTQIEHGADRRPVHLAEVLQRAIRSRATADAGEGDERARSAAPRMSETRAEGRGA